MNRRELFATALGTLTAGSMMHSTFAQDTSPAASPIAGDVSMPWLVTLVNSPPREHFSMNFGRHK